MHPLLQHGGVSLRCAGTGVVLMAAVSVVSPVPDLLLYSWRVSPVFLNVLRLLFSLQLSCHFGPCFPTFFLVFVLVPVLRRAAFSGLTLCAGQQVLP